MITINPFTHEATEELCSLFQSDSVLRTELNMPDRSNFSAEEEFRFISEWNKKIIPNRSLSDTIMNLPE